MFINVAPTRWMVGLLVFLFAGPLYADEPSLDLVEIKKVNDASYTVDCIMTFPNIAVDELHGFCWNVDNIVNILSKEHVDIEYTQSKNAQLISYECKYLFFKHNTTYRRERKDSNSAITFEALSNSHNIPFYPNTIKNTGQYSFSKEDNVTTIHYKEYVVCDDDISDLYMKDLNKRVNKYFKSFVSLGEQTYYE